MTDLHRLGHGLSYTDTKFIENKWVEWSKKQSKLVLNNFREGVLVTHVIDDTDRKDKTFNGRVKVITQTPLQYNRNM